MVRKIVHSIITYYMLAAAVGYVASTIAGPALPGLIVVLLLLLPLIAGTIEGTLRHLGHEFPWGA